MALTGRLEQLFSLHDRAIVVTGAGRGLGRAMTEAIADAGAVVVGVARSAEELRNTERAISERHGTFHPVSFDLRATADLAQLVDTIEAKVGDVFGIVHAAGVQLRKPAVDV